MNSVIKFYSININNEGVKFIDKRIKESNSVAEKL
jgi:hypothetical protein